MLYGDSCWVIFCYSRAVGEENGRPRCYEHRPYADEPWKEWVWYPEFAPKVPQS